MREVREPKPSKVGPCWLPAQHSLLCYFADFLHWLLQCALCCYQTPKARTLCVYIVRQTVTLLFFAATDLYIDHWLHWYSSLQMTFAFKTHNQIRQFLPLWRQFDQKYLFRGNYFYHTMCVFKISINSFDGMLSFSNRKKLPRKNWKYAVFPGFCAQKLQTFYQIVCLVFFLYFYYFLRRTLTLWNLGVFLCFCMRFECVCQL